jgi:hypothetical protein
VNASSVRSAEVFIQGVSNTNKQILKFTAKYNLKVKFIYEFNFATVTEQSTAKQRPSTSYLFSLNLEYTE